MSEVLQGLPGLADTSYGTILADPPWQFQNRTGKVAPEHRRLRRYRTMELDEICRSPSTPRPRATCICGAPTRWWKKVCK
jgi:hypothetical protein